MAGFRIIPRSDWTDTEVTASRVDLPHDELYVHHTVMRLKGGAQASKRVEAVYWRSVRRVHLNRGMSDIAYNFGACKSGRVWRLRGYGVRGGHTYGHNDQLAIVAAGDFEEEKPTEQLVAAILRFRRRSIRRGKLRRRSPMLGHRDVGAGGGGPGSTACPGRRLYKALDLPRRPR